MKVKNLKVLVAMTMSLLLVGTVSVEAYPTSDKGTVAGKNVTASTAISYSFASASTTGDSGAGKYVKSTMRYVVGDRVLSMTSTDSNTGYNATTRYDKTKTLDIEAYHEATYGSAKWTTRTYNERK